LQQTPHSVLAITTSSSAPALASALPRDNVPDQEYLFSELHQKVFAHNALKAVKYAARGGKQTSYSLGQILLLAIPRENRLTIKASRLPVRVIKIVKRAYTLLSSQGQIKSSYLASSLVPVLSGKDFGIPKAPKKGAKPITLSATVTKANNKKPISALQKAGNKATKKRKRGGAREQEPTGKRKRKEPIIELGSKEREEDEDKKEDDFPHRPQTQAKRLATQEAKAIALQHKLDKQFTRDMEATAARSSPTPALIAKRVRKSIKTSEK
jgi:hypothetical protein